MNLNTFGMNSLRTLQYEHCCLTLSQSMSESKCNSLYIYFRYLMKCRVSAMQGQNQDSTLTYLSEKNVDFPTSSGALDLTSLLHALKFRAKR